jgi:hypothetical protein
LVVSAQFLEALVSISIANGPEDGNCAVGKRPVSRDPGVYVSTTHKKGDNTMRFFLKISIPVEAGNAAAKKDRFRSIQLILEEQKPEAAYFLQDGGTRTAILIVNMEDASQLAEIVEPWFLALNASVECKPVMVAGDLQKAFPALERAVKTFG